MENLEDLTTHCIRCGFCLEDCPTFTETASELDSPRGRIYLIRSAIEGRLRWQEDVKPNLDRCLGCLSCVTACPSGVQYGAILEMARDKIEQEKPNLAKKMFLSGTTSPAVLRTQLNLARLLPGKRVPKLLSLILSGESAEAEMPQLPRAFSLPPLEASSLPPIKGEVYMLEGCAMRVLYPRVHACTRRLLRRIGYTVKEVSQGCCGALHAHNGYLDIAKKMALDLTKSLSEPLPIIVNSAGCGSTMKEYGHLLAGGEPLQESEIGQEFSNRVTDISQFLHANGMLEILSSSSGFDAAITYHDACHLSHGQKVTQPPRAMLEAIPHAEYRELPEALTCCGSAGIYNVVQPKLARQLLERKYKNIESTKATLVATGNPGCHAWIAQGAREHGEHVKVLHTAEMLEAAFVGLEPFLLG